VLEAAGERGPTYRVLVERYGPGDERLFGSVELRGVGSGLIIIISVDERVVSRLGERTALGNHLAFQVRRSKVAGRSGTVWLGEVFEAFCNRLSPVWGEAGHPDEYWAKVMSERPSIAAVGRDFGRFLPGVFWLNFFGRRYRDLFGEDRLRSTPASWVGVVDDGVLVGLGLEPSRWDTPEYAAAEQRVRDHLGAGGVFLQDTAGSTHHRTSLASLALPASGLRRGAAMSCPAGRSVPGRGHRSAGGVHDQTGPDLGPCWVRSPPGPQGHKRSPTVTSSHEEPQVSGSSTHTARTTPGSGSDCGPESHTSNVRRLVS
jgi:hypothetical protein